VPQASTRVPRGGAPPNGDVFDAIAHPLRRRVLEALAVGDLPAGALAASQPVSRPAVSQHLAVLRRAGLVGVVRRGRQRHYRLSREALIEVRDWIADLDRFWAERLVALGEHLDGTP
jgi:DNA-binding transcriptional ArsR family regulator